MTQTQTMPLSGFLNVLKPPGMSSAHVVGMVRRFFGGEKVGHAGTLDPEAAGVLPLMVGKATRLFDYLQEKEKAYVTEVAFGCATDTQDAQGIPVSWGNAWDKWEGDGAALQAALQKVLPQFIGPLEQRPPMVSAIQQDGKRMYQLAREGESIDLAPRQVTVHSLALERIMPSHGALIHVRCSKGFYVRSFCQDLGEALGCPAHMRFLLRSLAGVFTLDAAHPLEELAEAARQGRLRSCLLPVEFALGHLPQVEVPRHLHRAFATGGKLPWRDFPALWGTQAETGGAVCLQMEGRIAAIGRRQEDRLKLQTWLG